jgi:hypothetical protein
MNGSDVSPTTRRPRQKFAVKKPTAKKLPTASSLGQGVSTAASQRAAMILEVLGGERTPQQARILSMSLPNFYIVERKAMQGLLKACEPQPKGPPALVRSGSLQALQLELAPQPARMPASRQQVRAMQKAVGLPPALRADDQGKTGDKSVRRRALGSRSFAPRALKRCGKLVWLRSRR